MPLRSDLLNADVAVVWLDQDWHRSFGSGRLIASGLVLTAGHVVDCPARDNPISVGWKVRLIHDRPRQGEPRAATVIWPHSGRLDLALLRIDDAVPTAEVSLTYSLHDLSGPLNNATATGFPEARWNEFRVATDYSLHGTLWIAEQEGPFAWTVSSGDAPDKPEGWKGMSGAVVTYVDDRDRIHLPGAVQEVPKNFTDGQLRVARLADAFNDPTFTALLTAAIGCPVQLTRIGEPWPASASGGEPQHEAALPVVLDYVRLAVAFGSRQPVSRTYVWPKLSLPRFLSGGTPEIVDARTFLTKLLLGADSCSLVLLADYGSGKTSRCYMLGRELGKRALAEPTSPPIPLYLNLKKLRSGDSVFDAISRSLSDYGFDVAASDLRQLAAGRLNLVLFLDGLDEAGDRSSIPQMGSILSRLSDLREIPGLKWLLAARNTFFSSDAEVDELGADIVAELQLFSEGDVKQYFQEANMADSAVLNAIAQGNHGLLTLCQTPVHLYLLVSVLQQMAENGAPIPVERWWVDFLYDRFILHSIRVNFTSRLSHWRVEDRLSFLRQLACQWFKNRTYEWQLRQFESFLASVSRDKLGDEDLAYRSHYIANCSYFARAHDKFRFRTSRTRRTETSRCTPRRFPAASDPRLLPTAIMATNL